VVLVEFGAFETCRQR